MKLSIITKDFIKYRVARSGDKRSKRYLSLFGFDLHLTWVKPCEEVTETVTSISLYRYFKISRIRGDIVEIKNKQLLMYWLGPIRNKELSVVKLMEHLHKGTVWHLYQHKAEQNLLNGLFSEPTFLYSVKPTQPTTIKYTPNPIPLGDVNAEIYDWVCEELIEGGVIYNGYVAGYKKGSEVSLAF